MADLAPDPRRKPPASEEESLVVIPASFLAQIHALHTQIAPVLEALSRLQSRGAAAAPAPAVPVNSAAAKVGEQKAPAKPVTDKDGEAE